MVFYPFAPSVTAAPSDWLNATGYGADQTGGKDSTTAIQAALNAAKAGQVVYLPVGSYATSAPLVVPAGVRFQGPSRSLGTPIGSYGDGSLPITGAIITPTAAFTGAAVITVAGPTTSQGGGQNLALLAISGGNVPAPNTVHGIAAANFCAAVTLDQIMVYGGVIAPNGNGLGGDGLHLIPGTGVPDLWDVTRCHFTGMNGNGVTLTAVADSYFTDCESTGNTGTGWQITNGNNSRFVACKSEGNLNLGWALTGNPGFAGKLYFTTCTSGSNTNGGWSVAGTGTGTYYLNGCVAIEATPWAYTGAMNIKSSAAYNTSTAAPTIG